MTSPRPLLIALGLALATTPAIGQAPAAAPPLPPLVDVGLAQAPPTPMSVRVGQATEAVAVMKATLALALARLEAAREARDIVQVNCVAGKLAPMKGLLGIGEQAQESLSEAAARGDRALVEHEARKIQIARARAESFRVQVEGCVGEASQYTGDTRVELQVDPTLREDDPSRVESRPTFTPVSVARPPAISGSQ